MRRSLPAVLAGLCAFVVSGCGNTIQAQPLGINSLEGLLRVERYPIYWLGNSFEHIDVTAISQDPSGAYSIQYGSCITGGQSTCVTPLLVVTSPNNSFRPGGNLRADPIKTRGLRARASEDGDTIEVSTGAVVVDIYADRPSLARAALAAIAPINKLGAPQAPLPKAQPSTGFASQPLPGQLPAKLRERGLLPPRPRRSRRSRRRH